MRKYTTLLGYALPYWKGWALIVSTTVLSVVCAVLQPWPLKIFVDNVLGGAPLPRELAPALPLPPGIDSRDRLLFYVVAAGVLLSLLSYACEAVLALSWVRVGRRMVHDVACQLFTQLQLRSALLRGQSSVAESLTRVTSDSWCVNTVVDALLLSPLRAAIGMALTILLMARLDPSLTWLSLVVAPLMVGAALLLGRPIRAAATTHRAAENSLKAHVHQTFSGISVVQAFGREAVEQRRFLEYADAAIRSQLRNAFVRNATALTSGAIATFGTALVLFVGARRALHEQLSVGGLLIFLSYLKSLQSQIQTFTGIHTTLQRAAPSIDRALETLREQPEVPVPAHPKRLTHVQGLLRCEGVSFGYRPGEPVLHDLSFEALPGRTIAIVGPTGAGKSTLVGLLLRLWDPERGRISIDGHDLREVRLEDLRAQIGIVLQEPFLLPLSIAENVAYGRPGAPREAIVAAARGANAHDFIARLPHGYDTLIGERGATLSGGEKQRIAIARALLKDAPILILDEPTSALDSETEKHVLDALDRLAAGRTTLVIAHRLSTIRRADQILVLDRGRIVERGSHDELFAKRGAYAELVRLQTADPRTLRGLTEQRQ
jgi:ATP-binding cassette subfamily B protein